MACGDNANTAEKELERRFGQWVARWDIGFFSMENTRYYIDDPDNLQEKFRLLAKNNLELCLELRREFDAGYSEVMSRVEVDQEEEDEGAPFFFWFEPEETEQQETEQQETEQQETEQQETEQQETEQQETEQQETEQQETEQQETEQEARTEQVYNRRSWQPLPEFTVEERKQYWSRVREQESRVREQEDKEKQEQYRQLVEACLGVARPKSGPKSGPTPAIIREIRGS